MSKNRRLVELNRMSLGTMVGFLGIEYLEEGDGWLLGSMPVNERTRQPFNILHGGAGLTLAETLAGALSFLYIDSDTQWVKGIEVNGNHLRIAKVGEQVFGKATFLFKGRTIHHVQVEITNSEGKLVSITRVTNFIQNKEEYNK